MDTSLSLCGKGDHSSGALFSLLKQGRRLHQRVVLPLHWLLPSPDPPAAAQSQLILWVFFPWVQTLEAATDVFPRHAKLKTLVEKSLLEPSRSGKTQKTFLITSTPLGVARRMTKGANVLGASPNTVLPQTTTLQTGRVCWIRRCMCPGFPCGINPCTVVGVAAKVGKFVDGKCE